MRTDPNCSFRILSILSAVSRHNLLSFFFLSKKIYFIFCTTYTFVILLVHGHIEFGEIFRFDVYFFPLTFFFVYVCVCSESMCNNNDENKNTKISSEPNVLGGRLISLCGYIWHSWCFVHCLWLCACVFFFLSLSSSLVSWAKR